MLPKGDLAPVQREMIETTASKLSITVGAAGVLLRHFRWDDEALYKAWAADHSGVAKKANCAAILRQVMAAPGMWRVVWCGVVWCDVDLTCVHACN